MGWSQQIEYRDVEIVPPRPVKKQIWDGEKFVPVTLHRLNHSLSDQQRNWLKRTYGPAGMYINGRFWVDSRSGNYTIMDDNIYSWFQLKWSNK